MFTIKTYFSDTISRNYHAYSAVSYFVDYEPAGSINGALPEDATRDEIVGGEAESSYSYPRLHIEKPGGGYHITDVVGVAYIENAAGKTIDTIRPSKRA